MILHQIWQRWQKPVPTLGPILENTPFKYRDKYDNINIVLSLYHIKHLNWIQPTETVFMLAVNIVAFDFEFNWVVYWQNFANTFVRHCHHCSWWYYGRNSKNHPILCIDDSVVSFEIILLPLLKLLSFNMFLILRHLFRQCSTILFNWFLVYNKWVVVLNKCWSD